MAQVEVLLKNVSKHFMTRTLGNIIAVDNFNLEIYEGECFSFLGPSGCGKTTTLRMIAGFEDLTEGEIYLSGRPVSLKEKNFYIPPEDRNLGMVFQAFAVWPHMNVFENVAFPLKIQKVNRTELARRVQEALYHTNLAGLERTYPSNLSSGQQQRIALARAIVTNPRVMLLDEPLSNLDPTLRETMRFELKELQRQFNFTIVYVTHDQTEAMAISDRMLVSDMGRILQVGTPEELYNRPVSRFVHNFLGESTFLEVVIKDGKVYPDGDFENALDVEPPPRVQEGRMIVATRPNEIGLNNSKGYRTYIQTRIFLTDRTEYIVPVGNQRVKVHTPHRLVFAEGENCRIDFLAPMWYPFEDTDVEKERLRRQLI